MPQLKSDAEFEKKAKEVFAVMDGIEIHDMMKLVGFVVARSAIQYADFLRTKMPTDRAMMIALSLVGDNAEVCIDFMEKVFLKTDKKSFEKLIRGTISPCDDDTCPDRDKCPEKNGKNDHDDVRGMYV